MAKGEQHFIITQGLEYEVCEKLKGEKENLDHLSRVLFFLFSIYLDGIPSVNGIDMAKFPQRVSN